MTALRRRLAVVLGAALFVGGVGISPTRADVQVNTYTTSSQYNPAVAVDSDGDFIVVWASLGSPGTDSAIFSIQGQRFASDGSASGAQFQVNSYTTSSQRSPEVAMDADGDFVIVWESQGSPGTDSSGYSIQGQRYASDGSTTGAQFQVNAYTSSDQTEPVVGMDSDGDFVVAWTSLISPGNDSSSYSIQGQRYASDGSTSGVQFQVNTFTSSEQTVPSIDLEADGDFAIVWRSIGSGGGDPDDSIQLQRFASNGSMVGSEMQVNTYTSGVQTSPAVAVDADGDFVIVWQSAISGGGDTSAYSIQRRRYNSSGSALGVELQVNTYTTSLQFDAAVSMDSDGDFVVVWNSSGSNGTDTSGPSIQGQRYASNGSAVGLEFQVNTVTTSFQDNPSVGMDADGGFVVVWNSSSSSGDDTSYSIQKSDPGLVPVELQSFSVD
ncbi:MAG: hypothetical protein AAF560_29310 [Acidobacteriota bacterium]